LSFERNIAKNQINTKIFKKCFPGLLPFFRMMLVVAEKNISCFKIDPQKETQFDGLQQWFSTSGR